MKATTLLVALAAVSTYSAHAQSICKNRICTTEKGQSCDRLLETCPVCMGTDSSGSIVCKATNLIGSCSIVGIGGFQKCGQYDPSSSSSGSGSGSGHVTHKPTVTPTPTTTTVAPTTAAPTTTPPATTTSSPTTTSPATTKKPVTKSPITTPTASSSSGSDSTATATPAPTQTVNNGKATTTTDSGTNWALYGGIAAGALVLVALVMVVVLRMNRHDDDDDDEPYKPTAPTTSQTYASNAPASTYNNSGSAAVVAANLRAQIDGQNPPQTAYGNNQYGGFTQPPATTAYNNYAVQQDSYGNHGQHDTYGHHDNYSQQAYTQPGQYNTDYAVQDHSAVPILAAPEATTAPKPRSDVHHSDVWGNVPSSYQDGTPTAKTNIAHASRTQSSDVRENETRLSVEF
ncbi:hypothetical protein ACHHYP_01250 [Achlya hypogyna]|uniref:Secreted protein n=1 Tax=Achlya hypogyna TaxID=1202772 RepID=A0A1V9Z917_ACHHY|nr:hypothetical protein ACHHYP_01250 [Achlya hypogyna]